MHWVGFDVGKAFHWLCVLDGEGDVVLSKRVEASEERIEEALSEISGVGTPDERVVGIDILGGPATLLEALLLARANGCATSRGPPSTVPATPTPEASARAIRATPS